MANPKDLSDTDLISHCEALDATLPQGPIFVFDVESIGLHGEPYAVGYAVTEMSADPSVITWLDAGVIAIDPALASGDGEDRTWCEQNIPPISITHMSMKAMLVDLWSRWMHWRKKGAVMFAECAWPVEAKFLAMCIGTDYPRSKWDGPYPLHDVASVMLAAGMDPMANYDRIGEENPKHHPLADARQSARLLLQAFDKSRQTASVLRRAIAQRDEATMWQPIETAPKDGTSILAYYGRIYPEIASAPWDKEFQVISWCDDAFKDNKAWRSSSGCALVAPKAWQPLPQPPITQLGKAQT